MRNILTGLIVIVGLSLSGLSFAQDKPQKPSSEAPAKQSTETPPKKAPKPEAKAKTFDFEQFSKQAEDELKEKRGCSYDPPPEPVS